MGFAPKGISKLSELGIDVSKNWATYLIKNIGAAVDDNDAIRKVQAILQAVMTTQGDILCRGSSEAERIAGDYGIGYNFLHMANTGQLTPEWLDIQEIIRYISGGLNIMIAPPTLRIPVPEIGVEVLERHTGGGHTIDKSLSIPVPSIEVATATYTPGALDGVIADDGGAQTDETTEANNATIDDMTLLPATPEVDDAYYFGLSSPWDWLCLNISQTGAGSWTIKWEYWNGSTWVDLPSGYYDTSNGFRNGGKQSLSFVRPTDWATSSILLLDLYWVRARISAYSSITTQPLGAQAWLGTH